MGGGYGLVYFMGGRRRALGLTAQTKAKERQQVGKTEGTSSSGFTTPKMTDDH